MEKKLKIAIFFTIKNMKCFHVKTKYDILKFYDIEYHI